MADRTQAPSGMGYALENRQIVARAFPEQYKQLQVQALTGFFQGLQQTLTRLAPTMGEPPLTVLLTPGRYNETYFEHVYLARQLAMPLVEGNDLTVRQSVVYLKTLAAERGLSNVLFYDEVEPKEVPGLLAQCHVGLVVLDPRHKTHNVPGKFLTYMQAGMPVLARINAGNDLADLIRREHVGAAYVGDSLAELQALALGLCDDEAGREAMCASARGLAESLYSARAAVAQIVSAVSVRP